MSPNTRAEAPLDSFGDELSPGTELCGGQYTIESYLNSGGFGITYLARDSLGRKVVIKECFPGAICCRTRQSVRLRSKGSEEEFDRILELFEKEARALSELQHPYIVGVHQIFKDNGTAYMALDFVDGRDLLHVIETEPDRLGPAEIKDLLIKVLDAVAYMHGHDILHRDISPDNILLEADNAPVLIDFGAARESATRVSRVLSKVLTVKDGYSPQEFYLAGSEQAYASDLYALAATFYHLVSGRAPPSSQVRLAAAAKNLKDPLEPLTPVTVRGYDSFFLDAINRCLSIFPSERLQSAAEWRDLIDTERRQRRLLEEARNDHEMEIRIAQLVRESQRQAEAEAEALAAGRDLPQGEAAGDAASVAPEPGADMDIQIEADAPADATEMVVETVADWEANAEADRDEADRDEADREIQGAFVAAPMWRAVPLDDAVEDDEPAEREFPERRGSLFARIFAGSVIFRVLGAAPGRKLNEVSR